MNRQTIRCDGKEFVVDGTGDVVTLSRNLLFKEGDYTAQVVHGSTIRLPREVWARLIPMLARAVNGEQAEGGPADCKQECEAAWGGDT